VENGGGVEAHFSNSLHKDFFLGKIFIQRTNGLFFEKDERCSSVIAVKCLGTR
jgi:hypothetical protein